MGKTLARRRNGKRALVYAEKTPAQIRRRDSRRSASREQVADEVALLRGTAHDSFKQLQRLLRFVSGALRILLLQMADIVPNIAGIGGLIVIIAIFLAAGYY